MRAWKLLSSPPGWDLPRLRTGERCGRWVKGHGWVETGERGPDPARREGAGDAKGPEEGESQAPPRPQHRGGEPGLRPEGRARVRCGRTRLPREPAEAGAARIQASRTRPGWGGAGPEGARPARDDDRLRPGPRRALGGESAPGPRILEPATPPSPAPARAGRAKPVGTRGAGTAAAGGGCGERRPGGETPCAKRGSRPGIAGAEERPGGPVRGVPGRGGAGAAWWRLRFTCGEREAGKSGLGCGTQDPARPSGPARSPALPLGSGAAA